VVARAKRADIIVVQLHMFVRSGAMTGFVEPKQAALVKRLAELKKPMIGISFGNPYVAVDLPQFDAYVCGYSDAEVMQQAMVEVLFAEEPALGSLPVTIPGLYPYGAGLRYPKSVLRRGLPEEAGLSADGLRKVDEVMTQAVRDSACPGGVVLVARNGMVVYHKAFGGMDYGTYPVAVQTSTLYDLASVTKVISTTTAVMRLLDEGKFSLDDPVAKYVPAFGQNGKERITLYNLLVHNSGLPGWRKFYEFCDSPSCVRDSVFATPLVYRTGDSTLYSDLGLITIQAVIEKVAGTTLDRLVDSVFFRPLGMRTTMYNPPADMRERIAPTEVDSYWKKTGETVRGRVHDENAATLGGVSGHAGLFSTASDLSILMQMLLNGGTYGRTRYIQEATVRRFTTRQSDQGSRGIGWDTKSSDRSFSGRWTSLKTFLHTGFTGTSVVADPESGMLIVLLTNRVHPTRANVKISQVRPKVHEAVYEALLQRRK
jgi:CubicO group peptidase (beta-lactamase class C family)